MKTTAKDLDLLLPKNGSLLKMCVCSLNPYPDKLLGATDWANWMRNNLDIRLRTIEGTWRRPTRDEMEICIILVWAHWNKESKEF